MTKAWIFLVLATLFWAGNYVVGASAVQALSPVSLVWWRWALALVPLWVLAFATERPSWKGIVTQGPRLIALALTGFVGYNLLLYTALETTSSLNASLINAFNPALIVVGAAFLGQAMNWQSVLGVVLGLLGVVVVLTGGRVSSFEALSLNYGDLLMLGAIVCWTLYTLWGRKLKGIGSLTAVATQVTLVVLGLTLCLPLTGLQIPTTTQTWVSLGFIALFPSVGSYVLWNRALATVPPAKAGVSLNLITLFTALIGLALGAVPTWAQGLGGVLIIGGVLLSARRTTKA